MNTSLPLVVLVGICSGVGLATTLHAVLGGPPALDVSLRRLDDVGVSVAALRRGDGRPSFLLRIATRIARAGRRPSVTDLAATGCTIESFGIERLACLVALGALPLVITAVLALGGVGLPPGLVFVACVIGAVAGFLVPDLTLRSRAKERRHAFRYALSAYLDLVNVLLAGGAGVETALTAAADAGDGWVFDALRDTLVRARTARLSPWQALDELGRRLGVRELAELSASVGLAGEQGARIRMSLVAKAEALRNQHASDIEARAHAATERMGLPTVLMFIGFLVLLGYPAAVTVSTGIGG